MIHLFKSKYSKINTTPIFVIGSGRSGTHLLGRTFHSNPDTEVLIEDPRFFYPISKLAIGLDGNKDNLKKLFKKYKRVFDKTKKKYILEKTHPNIWFVEELLDKFPNAKFIGIHRNVYATVSSMLQHEGIMHWYKIVPLDKPNNFLGIDQDNIEFFKDLPSESKCTYRWIAHTKRLKELTLKYPDNVLILKYENFFDNYDLLIEQIKTFVNLDSNLNTEPLKKESLYKWKNFLTLEQLAHIDEIVNKTNL